MLGDPLFLSERRLAAVFLEDLNAMQQIRNILAPTDFSGASLVALNTACELARHFSAEISVLYVIPSIPALPADMNYTFEIPQYEDSLREAAEDKLDELVNACGRRGISARKLIVYGDPATEIVRAASGESVDWVVIATHGLTGWKHLVFGSVAEKVVRLSECPVLTIRAPRE